MWWMKPPPPPQQQPLLPVLVFPVVVGFVVSGPTVYTKIIARNKLSVRIKNNKTPRNQEIGAVCVCGGGRYTDK